MPTMSAGNPAVNRHLDRYVTVICTNGTGGVMLQSAVLAGLGESYVLSAVLKRLGECYVTVGCTSGIWGGLCTVGWTVGPLCYGRLY